MILSKEIMESFMIKLLNTRRISFQWYQIKTNSNDPIILYLDLNDPLNEKENVKKLSVLTLAN